MSKPIRLLVITSLLAGLLVFVPAADAAAPWAPWTAYQIGNQVTYNGQTYEALQAHTSQPGWEPPNVPALWRQVASGPTATPTRTNTPAANTPTPTRTPTRTNTPAGPTATPTRTPTPTATSSGGGCWPAWVSTQVYLGGAQVSRFNQNYQAAYWTQGNDPATSSGPAGSGQPWIPMGACGSAGPTPTPTRTNTPGGPTPTPTATSAGGFPATLTVVYADISFTSVQAALQATGQKYYALSFVLGNGGACVPAWDGTHPMSENYYAAEISAIRAGGGDVSAVFGGANGSDIASVCTTVSGLQAAYQAVINQYQLKWIDLNVEGSMIEDSVSVDRRNKAVAALQAANPTLKVSYTLPVTQTGLLQSAINLLNNAKVNNVRIDYVNIMTMNYGPAGLDMGQAAIDAATHTRNQLLSLGIDARLGITPMIGQNNTYGEIFDLGDADQVIAFARANSYVGWLSFWSLGRDNGNCAGQTTARADCSGISQTNYAFTNKFKAFP